MSRSLGLLALSTVLACHSSVDPNRGRFSCTTDADCGDGYQCRAQFAGGGRCFKLGECADVELCNGVDDTCDGRVDESFPEQGQGCDTGQQGPCSAGLEVCSDGGTPTVACARTFTPRSETCNAVDDDCNGVVDDGFDLTSSNTDCGACNHACGSGTTCRASACVEFNCADGLDNDSNGQTDCDDLACRTLDCGGDGGFNCGQQLALDAGLDGGADAGADAGGVDAGDLDGGDPDAGLDAGVPDGGLALVPACVARERTCDDGFDDDFDGLVDCADPDCDGLSCRVGQVCAMKQCPH